MPRVALLGSASLLDAHAPDRPAGGCEWARADAAGLSELGVDAAAAFEPSAAEREAIDRAGVPALLWHADATAEPPPRPHQRLVSGVDAGAHAWRCLAPPVADRLYADPRPPVPGPAAWLGPDTERRRFFMSFFEHTVEVLDSPAPDTVVALSLHETDAPAFAQPVPAALAAGMLVLSETLVPPRGLEPGIDYVEALDVGDLFVSLGNAAQRPRSFRRIQLQGRRKAELFRSSTVVARCVRDMLLELS